MKTSVRCRRGLSDTRSPTNGVACRISLAIARTQRSTHSILSCFRVAASVDPTLPKGRNPCGAFNSPRPSPRRLAVWCATVAARRARYDARRPAARASILGSATRPLAGKNHHFADRSAHPATGHAAAPREASDRRRGIDLIPPFRHKPRHRDAASLVGALRACRHISGRVNMSARP